MITFGIITNSQHHEATKQSDRLPIIISSIEKQNIPGYEIIIVGDYKVDHTNIKCIEFDETVKPAWITRKKNIIVELAQNDIIVFMHDYIYLMDDWYGGWQKFGFDWDLAMNIIVNKDWSRFRDWCVLWFDGNVSTHGVWPNNIKECPTNSLMSPYLPRYDYSLTKNMYVSGSYWLAKKYVMLEEPLCEDLCWSQPEDIEWSYRVLNKYKYVMNTKSRVKLLHQKDKVWRPLDPYYTTEEYIKRENL